MANLTQHRRENINALLKNVGIDADKFDVEAYWDSQLSYGENVTNISKTLNVQLMTKAELDRSAKAEAEAKETQSRQDYEKQVRSAESEAIQQIVDKKVNLMGEYFEVPKKLIRTVAQGYSNNLILTGPGGLSKSFTTLATLTELGLKKDEDFAYFQGYTTPLQLYQNLFHNMDKIVVFDDVEGILSDVKASSILKAAMWSATSARMIQYQTTSKALEVPGQFIFQGRVILCLNEIPRKGDESLKALLSRSLCYEFKLSFADKTKIIAAIAGEADYKGLNPQERMEIFEFVKENSDETTENYNIRTFLKTCDLFLHTKDKGGDWHAPAKELLQRNEDMAIMKELLSKSMTTREMIKDFMNLTGKGQATFYRLRKRYEWEMKSTR